MSKHYVIDFDENLIKGLNVEINRKETKVLRFVEMEVDGDPSKEQIALLIKQIGATGIKNLVVNYPDPAFVRTLSFPFSDTKKIEALIPYETADLIPIESEEVLIVNAPPVKINENYVTAVAGEKNKIRKIINLFENTGVTVSKIIYSPAKLSVFASEKENTLVIDLGTSETDIAFFIGEQFISARNYKLGSEMLIKKLASYSDQSVSSIKNWLKTSGTINFYSENEEGYEKIIRSYMDSQIKEWEKFIVNVEKKYNVHISKILITGEGADLNGILPYVTSGLQRKVEYASINGIKANSSQTSTLALALFSIKSRLEIPNFRKGEFSINQGYSLVKNKVLPFTLAVSLFAISLVTTGYLKLERLQKEESALLGIMGSLSKEVLGKKSFSSYYINRKLKKRFKGNGKINTKDNPLPKMSAYQFLGKFSEVLPPSKQRSEATTNTQDQAAKPTTPVLSAVKPTVPPKIKNKDQKDPKQKEMEKSNEPMDFDINLIEIKSGKMTIRGTVQTAGDVEIISEKLKTIKCVKEVKTGKIKTVGSGENEKREFSLDINNNCI